MKLSVTAVLVLVLVFLLGWEMAGNRQPPSPVPQPLANRPVARWVIHSAKSLLWVMAFAEEKPAIVQEPKRDPVDDSMKLVRSPGAEEARPIDWAEGY